MHIFAHAQVNAPTDSPKADSLHIKNNKTSNPSYNLNKQYDFGDLIRNIFQPRKKADTLHKGSGITIVPNIAANPTIGGQLGIKAVAGRRLGGDQNTIICGCYFSINHY